MTPPRLAAAVALALALASCAGPGARDGAQNTPPLARAALEEWRAWGGIVIEGYPEDRLQFVAATPDRFARLTGYWREVPGGHAVAARHEARRAGAAFVEPEAAAAGEGPTPVSFAPSAASAEDIGHYNRPFWSAAFVSAVARRAGLDLPPSATHARYVDALLARAVTDPQGAAFLPFDPHERAARPGDILCADRTRGAPLLHWRERLWEEGRARPMHCDIVVRAGPGAVEAVGGNVLDVVALRRLPADPKGVLLPAPEWRSRFFLLLAARGG